MRNRIWKAFVERLPAQEAARIEAAIEKIGQTQSELIRQTIQCYCSQNPNRIIALYPENSVNRWGAKTEADND